MEEAYRLKPLLSATTTSELHLGSVANSYLRLQAPDDDEQNVTGSDMSDRLIKIQIANHPLYPDLVSAYIECQKVGAPPELASLLEEIGRESHPINARREIGHGPELDDFMESYCEVLHRYKEELSKPFNEATLFLGDMESQLNNLCKGTLTKSSDNNRSGKDLISCLFLRIPYMPGNITVTSEFLGELKFSAAKHLLRLVQAAGVINLYSLI